MVPIYESDIAKERWTRTLWDNYELWERVELRIRQRKRWLVLATIILVTILFSIPLVGDLSPKWKTRALARKLGQTLQQMRTEAALRRTALTLHFIHSAHSGSLDFEITETPGCLPGQGNPLRSGRLDDSGLFRLLSKEDGMNIDIPGLTTEFCHDSMRNSPSLLQTRGFGIIPGEDLTNHRMDRISVLMMNGESAEISFD